ncbi:MAG: cytochrome c oxidase assembly protein [Candidatus Aquidulcis sp.]|nr:MAG: cytochrome c oxidase assembly protein [Candidatus Aquidulcis sp.]
MSHLLLIPAHGPIPPELSLESLLYWAWPPVVTVAVALVGLLWVRATRQVAREHPGNPYPRRRTISFVAALAFLLLALQSGIERYDTTLFSMHMVQHLILLFPVPILLLQAGPMTLLLRVASPRWRARILAVLQSRVVGVISHPLVGWTLLIAVMWGTHLSTLFEAALEDPVIHNLEHVLYLSTALLFWAPIFSVDPIRHRLRGGSALAYLITQMPQNSFLGVAIMFSSSPLYPHYVTLGRAWGPTPLEDQQLAGALMWLVGDALFLAAIFVVLAALAKSEDRPQSRYDEAQTAAAIAEIRRREVLLAERKRSEE